ncbi:MAG: AMP-binding protein [Abyssibacter sp.]|uniref:AMP-binding protein n=1 Tax=Abyssibacter sp. TaxID=2320200 RepID=UPI00321C3112
MTVVAGWQRHRESVVEPAMLWARAATLADADPSRPLLNLCVDRVDFATVLLAAAQRGQPCLLPSADSAAAIEAVIARYPDAQACRDMDAPIPRAGVPGLDTLPDARVATVGFTSGSTGTPKPVSKTWANLLGDAQCLVAALDRHGLAQHAALVATVPPQHMYGLELTVLTVLAGRYRVHAGRPFFPADVASALEAVDGPRVLVSTPVHLKAVLKSQVALPPVDAVISASAPLSAELARALESTLQCRVVEIYGSTETGAIASREPCRDAVWQLFPGIRFDDAGSGLICEHLPTRAQVQDQIEVTDSARFRLLGRPDDMIKVAGKRYSRQALTRQILAIPGVEDAAVVGLSGAGRVGAVVVGSPSSAQIRRWLAERIDPVFIPRPLRRVSSIPKTATGKPTAAAIRALLEQGDAE